MAGKTRRIFFINRGLFEVVGRITVVAAFFGSSTLIAHNCPADHRAFLQFANHIKQLFIE